MKQLNVNKGLISFWIIQKAMLNFKQKKNYVCLAITLGKVIEKITVYAYMNVCSSLLNVCLNTMFNIGCSKTLVSKSAGDFLTFVSFLVFAFNK